MKRRMLRGPATMGRVVLLVLGWSAPAGALSFSFTVNGNTSYCSGVESSTSYTARVSNTNCNRVHAILYYRDNGGTLRLADGGWQSYVSTATAQTIMITVRKGQGEKWIMGSPWMSAYKTF